jgi:phosphonate transport system permease protein
MAEQIIADGEKSLEQLLREKRRDFFLFVSGISFLGVLILPWFFGLGADSDFFSERRLINIKRFFSELTPYPLQGKGFDLDLLLSWMAKLWSEKGFEALRITLAISIIAIFLAGCLGLISAILAARPLRKHRKTQGLCGKSLSYFIFLLCLIGRAIPEYVWAFILLTVFGPNATAGILALALHNGGVLGRLYLETIENLAEKPLLGLETLGAKRNQIMLWGQLPLSFSRFLLYYLYRWETCVRESTVLGLLGLLSLGYWIQDARSRTFYDEMLFFILLSSLLVILGDLLSTVLREKLRNSE